MRTVRDKKKGKNPAIMDKRETRLAAVLLGREEKALLGFIYIDVG